MLSFLQKMIDHLLQIRVLQIRVLQIRVLQIRVLQIRVLQIQSVFYKSNPVHVLQYACFTICRRSGRYYFISKGIISKQWHFQFILRI